MNRETAPRSDETREGGQPTQPNPDQSSRRGEDEGESEMTLEVERKYRSGVDGEGKNNDEQGIKNKDKKWSLHLHHCNNHTCLPTPTTSLHLHHCNNHTCLRITVTTTPAFPRLHLHHCNNHICLPTPTTTVYTCITPARELPLGAKQRRKLADSQAGRRGDVKTDWQGLITQFIPRQLTQQQLQVVLW
ncbi:hypothetical protein Pmani_025956 [Petrolisthes manimaculis]|uniref:Uncharacterized protein n=1 Tax=Petrolisthes manimaculis TaxID=1843537 RepID=A0AAE1P767_9EUCA|nr:hypothetical protein Pmani_025956 [Petrolisthes manimaculis]